MKFAHLGDCHLGSWRFPELQELNMQSFSKAIDFCIREKVELVLITGDLFDSAYPPIDILKKTFREFRKLHNAEIPCFIIPGSHDYSVSGKTFLDVLEHAGFCKNVTNYEEKDDKIILHPIIQNKYAIYGYPGKKSGLEVPELRKLEIQDAPGFFQILMLHTSIREAIGNLPIDSISMNQLPKADYYALGHLHIDFQKNNLIYSGPIFPNNFEELEELNYGQFYIIDYQDFVKPSKIQLKLKDVLKIDVQINNTLTATEKILSELTNYSLEDKIVLLRISGALTQGRISDIKFNEIEKYTKEKNAYVFIKNLSKLSIADSKIHFDTTDMQQVEDIIIKKYLAETPTKFNRHVQTLLKTLNHEKQEDETNQAFQQRLTSELNKTLSFENEI